MLLKTILNRIQKYRGFVYAAVLMSESPMAMRIEVEIRPHRRNRPICSGCSRTAPGYDRLPMRLFEFVPLWGIPVFFAYAMRRVNCPQCGVTVEVVPWAEGKSHVTTAYAWFLAKWAKRMSWREVADAFRTSWETVFRSVEMAVTWGRAHIDLEDVESIGVDEVQWQRGHHYLTLVYQIDAGLKRLLWVGLDRKAKTLLGFFRWLGPTRTAAIQFVCSDMWKPYLKVIAKKAGRAIHVLDRFHVMSHMNKAIDEVRAEEARALKANGHAPILKHSRWTLLKRPENLTPIQEIRLADLVRYNLRSVRSYLLREDFQGFWDYVSPHWAGEFLKRWCTRTMRSRIEPMKKVARMLRRHHDLLLNWFRAKGQISAGAVEGLNLKVKLTTRKAYGFRTFKAIEIALLHALGDLPEPKTAHEFS